MGRVYLAEHIYTGKKIALKTLLMGWLGDLSQVERLEIEERFRREAQAAAQISHENVVQIFDFDLPKNGLPAYISMELLEGESLEKILSSSGALPLDRAIFLMSQICAGIGEAHKRGFVHRDLKPANIIVIPPRETVDEAERVKIIDFGIAKVFDADLTKITKSGQLIGTPKYMSPEQCRGEEGVEIDERADVYSLGLIFYELLTGILPFSSKTVEGWMLCHLLHEPQEMPDFVPPEIKDLIMRSIEKDREKRPRSATVFGEEILNFRFNQSQVLVEKQRLEEQTRIQQIIQEEKRLFEIELRKEFEANSTHLTAKIEEMRRLFENERREHLDDLETMSRFSSFYNDGFAEIELLLRELREDPISRIEERIRFYRGGREEPFATMDSADNQSTTDGQRTTPTEQRPLRGPIGKKIRIYDLARDLKQDTKRIMEDLRREGVNVSIPSNSVSVEMAEKVRNKYFPKVEAAPKRAIKIIRAAKKEDIKEESRVYTELETRPTPATEGLAESPQPSGPRIFRPSTDLKRLTLTRDALEKGIKPG